MVEKRTARHYDSAKTRGMRRIAHLAARAAAALLFSAASVTGLASADSRVPLVPPAEITHLLEAEPLPRLAQDPQNRYALLVHEHRLLPTEHLAEPAVSVAGLKVNPRTYGRHAPIAYYRLTLVELASGVETPLPVPRRRVG